MSRSSLPVVVFLVALVSACSTSLFPSATPAPLLVPAAQSPPVAQTYQPPVVRPLPQVHEVFTLGPEDVVSVTVYDNDELNTTQAVRPDGYLAVLSAGEIKADGRTVTELRREIERRLSKIIRKPIVNVAVNQYNSRKVAILGAVGNPGVVRLQSAKSLLEAISDVGGIGADADLHHSVMFRGTELVPVNFHKLFKGGDISQNIKIEKNDTIFIASRSDNRIYVLGEVGSAGTYSWVGGLSLLEAIPLAGGYKRDAETREVLVIKGGLAEPKLMSVDAKSIFEEGRLDQNVALESGDIIYVPKTRLATLERYFEIAAKALQPILGIESAVILGQGVLDVIEGKDSSVNVSIPIGP